MPIFEYECSSCRRITTELSFAGEQNQPACCGSKMNKIVSRFATPNESWKTFDEKRADEAIDLMPSTFDPSVSAKQFREERRPIFGEDS